MKVCTKRRTDGLGKAPPRPPAGTVFTTIDGKLVAMSWADWRNYHKNGFEMKVPDVPKSAVHLDWHEDEGLIKRKRGRNSS